MTQYAFMSIQKISDFSTRALSFRESFFPPLVFILALWLIHFIQEWCNFDLGYWGIYPRESLGLRGILFAPLLHGDWGHLASNSVPFLVLATMVVYFYPRVALKVFMLIYFVTGFAVWLFARSGVFHIGLSYVVYGLVSFVFFTGIFRRSVRSIILALIVTILYSGMIAGILPTNDVMRRAISWESHLMGAIIGLFLAYFYKEEIEEDEATPSVSDEEKRHYFPQDIFDKTKEERWREAEEERLRRELERRLREEEERQRRFPPYDGWTSNSSM
jgi:membrane associated rhomboid family serine protease